MDTSANKAVGASEAVAANPKKDFAKAKRDHELHVALIMRKEDVTKSHALVIAYREGQIGLSKRLDE